MSYLRIAWLVVKNLPAFFRLIEQLNELAVNWQKQNKEKENKEIKDAAENAKTPEQKRAAVDHAADRFSKQ